MLVDKMPEDVLDKNKGNVSIPDCFLPKRPVPSFMRISTVCLLNTEGES